MAPPAYKPTAAARRRVEIMAGGGMAHERIALALGVARGTLLKHFPVELDAGAARREGEVVEAMFKAAKRGNVTAQRAYLARGELGKAAAAWNEPAPDKEPKRGKKEQAAIEAGSAGEGTDWGNDLQLPGSLPN